MDSGPGAAGVDDDGEFWGRVRREEEEDEDGDGGGGGEEEG